MKTRLIGFLLIISFVNFTGYSQENTREENKHRKEYEKQKQIEELLNSKKFVFVAKIALPSGIEAVILPSNEYYLKFNTNLIESHMPFFGYAFSGTGYGTDTGLQFTGQPEVFKIEKKEKTFQIEVVVKGETDNFILSLSVDFEGSSSLTISSNKRSTITYKGEISAQ